MSMSTSSKVRLETIRSPPKHVRDKSICSTLSDDLREQYDRRSIRVIKGDTVKIMRGEYTGIEGKVEKVNTRRGTLSIEGVQREKVKGGNVKVQIHSSNVRVSGLNLDDKYRQNKIRRRDQQQQQQQQQQEQQEPERKEVTSQNKDKNQKKKSKYKRIDNKTSKKRQLFKSRSRKGGTKKNSANENKNATSTDKKNKNKTDSSADNSQVTNQNKEEKRGER
ncbi:MAG TPA: 50S ribosomal protein L24 [Nitrososphaeraceae archaeon]|nr:50S ribosomal protein L24 [Nitrososphaeraceae archaeon]